MNLFRRKRAGKTPPPAAPAPTPEALAAEAQEPGTELSVAEILALIRDPVPAPPAPAQTAPTPAAPAEPAADMPAAEAPQPVAAQTAASPTAAHAGKPALDTGDADRSADAPIPLHAVAATDPAAYRDADLDADPDADPDEAAAFDKRMAVLRRQLDEAPAPARTAAFSGAPRRLAAAQGAHPAPRPGPRAVVPPDSPSAAQTADPAAAPTPRPAPRVVASTPASTPAAVPAPQPASEAAERRPGSQIDPSDPSDRRSDRPSDRPSHRPPEAQPDLQIVEVPAATAGRTARRAGRVKTRLLGFEHSRGTTDPLAAAAEAAAEAATADPAPRATANPEAPRYPVGWIVVVKGPGRGASFTLSAGVSQIGRGEDQAVRLDFGDTSISRNNHAVVAYDPEQRKHLLGHGGKANIVRLNDLPVLSTETLSDGDRIRIGETTLRFVAFCGEDFDWQTRDASDEEDDDDLAVL